MYFCVINFKLLMQIVVLELLEVLVIIILVIIRSFSNHSKLQQC